VRGFQLAEPIHQIFANKLKLFAIVMAQLYPAGGVDLNNKFPALIYQAIVD